MKPGALLATIVVVAYISFEIYVVHKMGYRMEPLFVLNEFVQADQAATECATPPTDERQDFLRNFAVVQRNALADLAESSPQQPAATLEAQLSQLISDERLRVTQWIATEGCKDKQSWRWAKLHEVRARLNLR